MTNTQLWMVIGIPTFMVLIGILFGRLDTQALRIEIRAMNSRIDTILTEFGQFHHTQGQHDARLDSLKERLDKNPPTQQ